MDESAGGASVVEAVVGALAVLLPSTGLAVLVLKEVVASGGTPVSVGPGAGGGVSVPGGGMTVSLGEVTTGTVVSEAGGAGGGVSVVVGATGIVSVAPVVMVDDKVTVVSIGVSPP